ncbi:MAG: response regulator [Bdellovibrionaceae bacterium]|nr:response regulator [Pseudobdellovibrionaceae bacterium]
MSYIILVVEDEPDIRDLISMQLEAPGREFLFAGNGEEAIEVLSKNKIDFMITDLAMPKMNGFEMLRKIKKHGWVFPVMVLTGHADVMVANQLRPYGVEFFMNKPWEKELLENTVKQVMSRVPAKAI